MTVRRAMFAASLIAFLLAGCVVSHTIPPMPPQLASAPTTEQDRADAKNPALWGIFTDLPGKTFTSGRDGGTTIVWRWVRPGWVMEEARDIRGLNDPIVHTVWRGEQPGVLYSQGVGLMALAWQGKVQADGSVLFEGAGMLSASHLISMTPDRTLEIRAADVQDGVLVSLSDPLPTDRYVDNDRRTENTSATKNGKATAAASTLASNTSKTNSHRDYQATNASEASGAESSSQAAVAKAESDVKHAQMQLQSAQQDVAKANDAVKQAELAVKSLSSAGASTGSAPKNPDKRGDFWSFCYYSVLGDSGTTLQTYVTYLINQRIWSFPFPEHDKKAIAEFDAYDGPNTYRRVKDRFENAMRTSGLLPQHYGYAVDCETAVNYKIARDKHQYWHREKDPKPTFISWSRLEDKHIVGSKKIPTPEEAEKIKQRAEEARQQLKQAQAAAKEKEQRLAQQEQIAKRQRECAAGVKASCGARGTKN